MLKFILTLTMLLLTTPVLAELTPEDLEKIQTIVETTIDKKIEPLQKDINTLKADVTTLKADVITLKADVITLKADVAALKWLVGIFIGINVALLVAYIGSVAYIFKNTSDRIHEAREIRGDMEQFIKDFERSVEKFKQTVEEHK